MRARWFRLAAVALLAQACQSPTRSIRPDIAAFEQEMPDHFYRHSGPHRVIKAAWSGDPGSRPLLLIHGSPGSWQGWAAFLRDPSLAARFHIIAVDRPGYGGSGAGAVERSLSRQVADIASVLDENRSGLGAIVVGHSMGGPLAAQLAMEFPDRVAGLVLVSSSVSPDLEKTKWYQIPADWTLLRWLIPEDLKVCNQEILALKGELEKMRPRWPLLHVPIAIIQGQVDDLVPAENVDFLLAHLKATSVVDVNRLPGMNHFVPWRAPESIVRGIEAVERALALAPIGF